MKVKDAMELLSAMPLDADIKMKREHKQLVGWRDVGAIECSGNTVYITE